MGMLVSPLRGCSMAAFGYARRDLGLKGVVVLSFMSSGVVATRLVGLIQ